MKLSQRVSKIKPSPTIAAAAKARKMQAEGIKVIDFTVGEPDFDTPEPIKEAAIHALHDGFTKYTPASGIDALKKAVCKKLEEENGLRYQPEQIVCSCGAKHALFNAFQALLDPGDQIIIPAPYWVSYPDMALLCDAEPVIVETTEETGFKPTPQQIADALTDRTKIVLLNSPSNPTGAVMERELLKEIADVILKRDDVLIISDEIYEKLIYDGKEHVSVASFSERIKERTIVINGFSKTFAMTGWRLGYAAAPEPIAKAMGTIQSQSTTNPTSFVQVAAIEALRMSDDVVRVMVQEFDRRRKLIVSLLNDIPPLSCLMPEGAFYVFVNVKKALGKDYDGRRISNDLELCDYLLEKAHVATVAGEGFGAPGYLRISYATSQENLREGARRLAEALR